MKTVYKLFRLFLSHFSMQITVVWGKLSMQTVSYLSLIVLILNTQIGIKILKFFSFINWNQFEDNMYIKCSSTNIFCNIYHFRCKNNFCTSNDDKLKSLASTVKSRDRGRVRKIIKHFLKHFMYMSLFTFHHNSSSIFDCIYLSMPLYFLLILSADVDVWEWVYVW